VWVSWGTTYLALRIGVRDLPPFLFSGSRITLAGLILIAFFFFWKGKIWLKAAELWPIWASALFLFVGGNGLCTWAEKTVESGLASVLVATTPLWMTLFDSLWPGGSRIGLLKWLGMLVGFAGVCLIVIDPSAQTSLLQWEQWEEGNLMALASAFCWAVGSIVQRRLVPKIDAVQIAGWQMRLGGLSLWALGLLIGEGKQMGWENLTRSAIGAFFYLLLIGSLLGFVAYVWLLQHTTPAVASTYGYVNPVVAVFVGWALAGESPGWVILPAMALILLAVFIVRLPIAPPSPRKEVA
jgi:drug/metabolite transporter (DMT)-like permease